jgi:hypothetical protein
MCEGEELAQTSYKRPGNEGSKHQHAPPEIYSRAAKSNRWDYLPDCAQRPVSHRVGSLGDDKNGSLGAETPLEDLNPVKDETDPQRKQKQPESEIENYSDK